MMIYEQYLKNQSIDVLIELWERLKHEPVIKGWLMSELERRNQQAFDNWIDADFDEAHPEKYEPRYYFL